MNWLERTRELQRRITDGDVETVTGDEAAVLMDELVDVVRFHARRYYREDDPVVADVEYDDLYAALSSLEGRFPDLKRKDSPTHRVGAEPADGFEKVRHPEPLLSLGNAFDAEELIAWYDRCRRRLNLDADASIRLTADTRRRNDRGGYHNQRPDHRCRTASARTHTSQGRVRTGA